MSNKVNKKTRSHCGMPDKNDITALAKWLDETAIDLIQQVMAKHTGALLETMKELVDDRKKTNAVLEGCVLMPDDETLKRMAMAHDAEDAAQRGEPSPWTEGDLDPEWVDERIACMRAAMIAAAKEGE